MQSIPSPGCCDPWETKVVRAGCGAHFRLRLMPTIPWDTLANHVPEDAQIFLADVSRAEDLVDDFEDEEEEKGEHRAATTDRKDMSTFDIKEENIYEVDEEGNKTLTNLSYNDPQHLELYSHVRLPTLSYDRLELRGTGGAVLVIGGEMGLSNAAKKFVADHCGSKVTVPLANGMDSLNVGVASGIVLYAMQKQLHELATQRVKERQEGGG